MKHKLEFLRLVNRREKPDCPLFEVALATAHKFKDDFDEHAAGAVSLEATLYAPLSALPCESSKQVGIESVAAALIAAVERKRKQGLRLTAVEAHLARNVRALRANLLAPSLFWVAVQLGRLFLKPVPVLFFFLILIATERSSSAWWPSTADLRDAELQIEQQISPITAAYSRIRVNFPSPLPIMGGLPFTPRTTSSQDVLISFITSVIATYYPSIEDAERIAEEIVLMSHEHGVDPLFVASIVATESSFRTHARSDIGALGLMQIRPSTARDVLKRNPVAFHPSLRLTDTSLNLKLGITYLKELEQRYDGNRFLALAAYNWGPANVAKANQRKAPLPKSVRRYSSKILENTRRWHMDFQQLTLDEKATTNQLNG